MCPRYCYKGGEPDEDDIIDVIQENDLLINSEEEDSLTKGMTKFTFIFSRVTLPRN